MNKWIAWFAKNSVAANLLVAFILISGILAMFQIKQEVFPEISADMVQVQVLYRGAAPEEVEEGVCVKIEEEVQSLYGIKEITSQAMEGVGIVKIEALPGADIRKLLGDVKARVDAISTFPEETEKPVVSEVLNRRQVINIAVSGDTDEHSLKRAAEKIRDDLLQSPHISQVDLTVARPYELSVEVSEETLRRYNLTFDEVVQAIRLSSLDLPGGTLKTRGGEILLRTKGQAYKGHDFESLVLRTNPDGSRITVGDVAAVVDGFAETDQAATFDGRPAVMAQVYRVGDEDALSVAGAVKRYVETNRQNLPEGIKLDIWKDESKILKDRRDLLLRNGRLGLLLVFITLALFLRFRLAFWVALGIPVSFLGAVWLMPYFHVSINMVTLFAFIVVIGIVVDDAIIIGENIYTHFERGKTRLQAAVEGAQEVAVPVVFAVLTTVAAFWPLLNVAGNMGKVFKFIPIIIISTLFFSLIESLFILPAHLSHLKEDDERKKQGLWRRFQGSVDRGLRLFIDKVYRPSLELALAYRYTTIAVGVSILLITMGLVGAGLVKFTFFPKVEADNVMARLKMPLGTPIGSTTEAIRRIEAVALKLDEEFRDRNNGKPVVLHILTSLGEQPSLSQGHGPAASSAANGGSHLGEVDVELVPSEGRLVGSVEIAQRWRELVGPVPDVDQLTYSSSLFSAGDAVNVRFASSDYAALQAAADMLKERLAEYPGVFEIADSYQAGKQEIKMQATKEAEALGLTQNDLGRQVRQAFFGEEAQRIQRGRDEVKVMVRYPKDERRSLNDLESMRIRVRGSEGLNEIPFSVAANARVGVGYAAIQRTDRQRTINVTADVDEARANINEIMTDVHANVIPKILERYPHVKFSLEGVQREQQDSMRSLTRGFLIALLAVYVLLAIPFKSYIQPVIVMTAIPFGIVGAVWGHVIMGLDLSLLSMMGIVALSGVVVNDSLVMVDYINNFVRSGHTNFEAIRLAGVARFRPILLTSFTTFAGLTPMLLEKSLQARFMIPMAVSLAFGVIFSTFITLIMVPVGFQVLEDIRVLIARFASRWKAADNSSNRLSKE